MLGLGAELWTLAILILSGQIIFFIRTIYIGKYICFVLLEFKIILLVWYPKPFVIFGKERVNFGQDSFNRCELSAVKKKSNGCISSDKSWMAPVVEFGIASNSAKKCGSTFCYVFRKKNLFWFFIFVDILI